MLSPSGFGIFVLVLGDRESSTGEVFDRVGKGLENGEIGAGGLRSWCERICTAS